MSGRIVDLTVRVNPIGHGKLLSARNWSRPFRARASKPCVRGALARRSRVTVESLAGRKERMSLK